MAPLFLFLFDSNYAKTCFGLGGVGYDLVEFDTRYGRVVVVSYSIFGITGRIKHAVEVIERRTIIRLIHDNQQAYELKDKILDPFSLVNRATFVDSKMALEYYRWALDEVSKAPWAYRSSFTGYRDKYFIDGVVTRVREEVAYVKSFGRQQRKTQKDLAWLKKGQVTLKQVRTLLREERREVQRSQRKGFERGTTSRIL